MFRASLISIVLCLVLGLCSFAGAQIPGFSGLTTPARAPAGLTSPRAAMRTYLEAMNAGDIGTAAGVLDLSEMSPLIRPTQGPLLAFRLWAILNRQEYIEYGKLSDSPTAPPFSLTITNLDKKDVGAVTLDKSADGGYRFTPDTIASLDQLWQGVKDKPVVHGLADPGLENMDPGAWIEEQMPASSKVTVLGVQQWKWIVSFSLLLLSSLFAVIVRFIVQTVVGRLVKRGRKDEGYREIGQGGFGLSVLVFAQLTEFGIQVIGLPAIVIGVMDFLCSIASVIGVALMAFAVSDAVILLYARHASSGSESAETLVAPVLSRLAKGVIAVIAAVILLTDVGVNISGLVATLGIGGLVLGLAAKDSVENLFGSIMVLIERPFRLGDWVKVGDVSGTVEEIHLRSTRIRTFEDSLIVVPNSMLVTKSIENFGARRFRRFKTTVDVSPDTPIEQIAKLTEATRKVLKADPHVWDDMPFVYLNDFGPQSLKIQVCCMLLAANYKEELEIRDRLLGEFLNVAKEVGVRLAPSGTSITIQSPAPVEPA